MAVPIIYTDTPFGFRIVQLGTLTIYCGKLRYKDIKYVSNRAYLNVKYVNGYCIISFEVTDRILANDLYQEMGRLAKGLAQARVDQKWGWVKI